MAIRVAITQHAMVLGGRLRVIIEIIKMLNQHGICPDIISSNLRFQHEQIEKNYGIKIDANYIETHIPHVPLQIDEFNIIRFNRKLHALTAPHDLIINTNNSLYGLPLHKDIVTYMFFPRKRRINATVADIHIPEKKLKLFSRHGVQRLALRGLYRNVSPTSRNQIISMTDFTATALRTEYPGINISKVIYPPVDLEQFRKNEGDHSSSFSGRLSNVITSGRFTPNKRQLQQIQLAQKMPQTNFHIVGFAQNNPYYLECKEYVEREQVGNVFLYPDAPFEKMQELMQKCGIFLHTLIDEPFGLTAVQAIAAGCIPVVHNSGGQQETVCEPSLRYDTFEQVPPIIHALQKRELAEIHRLSAYLQNHIQQFDTSVFRQNMDTVLRPYIK